MSFKLICTQLIFYPQKLDAFFFAKNYMYSDIMSCVAHLAGVDHVIHPLSLGLVVALLKLLNVIT
jgi:hypothetical protein